MSVAWTYSPFPSRSKSGIYTCPSSLSDMYVSFRHPPSHFILTSLLKRGTKIERARELFDQALEQCPQKLSKPLYLMYAQLEEEHGLAKRAMSIYDRAT